MSELLTMQDLANGHLDVKALGEAANGDENTIVTTRTGNTYPSAERAINIMFQNGGLPAKPFPTKAKMETDGASLADGQLAMVHNEIANNGLYVKTAGTWVKAAYDPLAQAKSYTDTNKADILSKLQNTFDTKALMTASPLPDDSRAFVGSDTTADNNGFYKKTAGVWSKVAYNPVPKNDLVQKSVTEADYTFDVVGIDTRNGLSFGGNTNYKATGYIAIEPNISYQVKSKTGNGFYGGAWYDLNRNYISGFSAETLVTVISPVNAVYVRLSYSTFYADNTVLFEPTSPRVNVENVTNIIESRTPAPEPKLKEVVYSQSELENLNLFGKDDKAYPIGRRVYDHSLRKEVTADGAFWRLPDGTAAALAERVYIYPDWDEMRAALPTTAKAYRSIFNITNPRIADWKSTSSTKAILETVEVDGKSYLSIDGNAGAGYMYLEDSGAVLNQHLVCKIKTNLDTVAGINIALLSATEEVLFSDFYSGIELLSQTYGTIRINKKLSTFTSRKSGATLSDVAYIGIRVNSKAGNKGAILLDGIETVTYKPKITLRFDDNKPSVYSNAYPILQQYGFRGLIAVITNQVGLANDPDFPISDDSITKEGLLELGSMGWDLVSHTHTHEASFGTSNEYLREIYKRSRDYLRHELNAGMIASSCLVSPRAVRDERLASIQREFYDCQISRVGLNEQLLRQPEGFWEGDGLWTSLSGDSGDNNASAAKLISYAQKAIDEGGWSILMMHKVGVPDDNFSVSIEALTELCAWLDSHRDEIDVVTVSDVVREVRPND